MAKKGRLTNEERERKKGLAKVLFLQVMVIMAIFPPFISLPNGN